MNTTAEVINIREARNNSLEFAAWYQGIAMILNYWTNGNGAEVMRAMQGIPVDTLVAEFHRGATTRDVADTIASAMSPRYLDANKLKHG